MLEAMRNAFKLEDVRQKLIFTFVMLVIFRFIAHIPVPGVNLEALSELFRNNQFLGMLDLFSGGAMTSFSIAAMGVYPYITAQIIMQVLTPVVPQLEELSKEGEAGRTRINQYTHWLTVPLAIFQAYGTSIVLQSQQGGQVLKTFGLTGDALLPTIAIVISMTAGTILLVWMGELITENGIGNGVSLIIFAGIVSRLPQLLAQQMSGTANFFSLAVFAIIGLITIVSIVIIQEAQRRIPVQYAKRVRGTKMYGGQSTHIPLRVNSAGMIPLIFGMSMMLFPGTVASYFMNGTGAGADIARFIYNTFNSSGAIYWIFYFILVVGMTFFYTMVIFQQQNLAENLQKYGGFVPGIRPGRPTAEYLNKVLYRITWLGAFFLGIIAILPFFTQQISASLVLSSTGLLIVVGVVLDTMKQLESQLMMRHYEGFIK